MCPHSQRSKSFSRVYATVTRVACWILFLSIASNLSGQGPVEVSGPGAPSKTATSLFVDAREYVISPDDVLDVYILDVPELSRTYRVNQSGLLLFPLLPRPLRAAGFTLEGFSALLASELKSSGTISDPHVSVTVKESRLHSISITGAVKNPQVYPLFAPAKLLSVLSQAGGVSDDAGSTLKVTRGGTVNGNVPAAGAHPANLPDDGPQTVIINLNDLLNSGNPSLNIVIFPGDWINVPRAGVIYVVGAVNRPGGYVLNTNREHLSVLQLVALAEDLKPTAKREHAMIIRRQPVEGAERQEIAIDLKKILAGKSPDVTLEGNDILFVPDSTGKRALRRGAEAAIQIATGVALFHL
jgi:polysaccharide export outer membrane protein